PSLGVFLPCWLTFTSLMNDTRHSLTFSHRVLTVSFSQEVLSFHMCHLLVARGRLDFIPRYAYACRTGEWEYDYRYPEEEVDESTPRSSVINTIYEEEVGELSYTS